MASKILGYILSAAGIIGLAISALKPLRDAVAGNISIFARISSTTLLVASIVLVAAGVFILMQTSKPKQAEEVPIYEGEGKKRRIVGYQRMK